MSDSFRKKPAKASLPKPKWPPIQQLDSVDITGKRTDGGVDLVIVASQPLDESAETLASIRQKVRTYLAVVGLDEFQAEMGHPPRDRIRILLTCDHAIHPAAQAVIEECQALAAADGVRLEVRQSLK